MQDFITWLQKKNESAVGRTLGYGAGAVSKLPSMAKKGVQKIGKGIANYARQEVDDFRNAYHTARGTPPVEGTPQWNQMMTPPEDDDQEFYPSGPPVEDEMYIKGPVPPDEDDEYLYPSGPPIPDNPQSKFPLARFMGKRQSVPTMKKRMNRR